MISARMATPDERKLRRAALGLLCGFGFQHQYGARARRRVHLPDEAVAIVLPERSKLRLGMTHDFGADVYPIGGAHDR